MLVCHDDGTNLGTCVIGVRENSTHLRFQTLTETFRAATEVQALACGGGTMQDLTNRIEATAHALAEAVVVTEVSCSSNGGEDTQACGFARGDVEVIARAQVRFPSSSGTISGRAVEKGVSW